MVAAVITIAELVTEVGSLMACRRYASLMKVASSAGNHDRSVPPCSSWRPLVEECASTERRRRAGSRNDTSPWRCERLLSQIKDSQSWS